MLSFEKGCSFLLAWQVHELSLIKKSDVQLSKPHMGASSSVLHVLGRNVIGSWRGIRYL